ncbi:MAG: hypothetical protein R3A51_06450 [Nannocystaceae bacterium]
MTDAGEFLRSRYRANPHDRCYFCKSNLYGRIRALTSGPVASGANTDDLGDYRPGLLAASEGGVVHPMIEAAMGKADVRALARHIGLPGIAELPAQPCLASRVETGIAIDADDLRFVERVERHLARIAGSRAVLRCRITAGGVVVEIGPECEPLAAALSDGARALAAADGRSFAGLRSYRRGSMFVRA